MERLGGLLLQLRSFFLALPPARRLSFLALTVAVVCGTGALAVWVQHPQYRVLFAKLRPGRVLTPDQIGGVVHLVAASVEGLKPSDVTVVDINGKVLTHETEEAGGHPAAGQGMLAFQREVEQGYGERIESMLERVLG